MFSSPNSMQNPSHDFSVYGTPQNRMENAQEQTTPAFLFGNKRRSMASTSTFANSPLQGPMAPTTDIFASPALTAIPNHMKESTSNKSVHWSPSLVQQQSPQFGSPSITSTANHSAIGQPAKSSTGFASPLNAPPLRSMRDDLEPVKKAPRRSVQITLPTANTTANAGNVTFNDDGAGADTWVTVFGFAPTQVAAVLKLFSRHGEVVSHQTPAVGNFMHLRYSCATHAIQALSRNGTLLAANTFIGVVPCTDKDILAGTASGIVARAPTSLANRSLLQDSIMEIPDEEEVIIPAVTPSRDLGSNENWNNSILSQTQDMNQSLNSSRISVRSGVGMRSLAVDRTNTNAQNKQDGLFNKLWNTMGF